jgi:DNA-binding transcriptional ArsR family regulator
VDREALAELAPGWEDGCGMDVMPMQELLACVRVEERFGSWPLYTQSGEQPGFPLPAHFFFFGNGPEDVDGLVGEPGSAPLLFTHCEPSTCGNWVALYAAGSVHIYRADGGATGLSATWNSYDRGSVRVVFLPSGLMALESYDENNGYSNQLYKPSQGTLQPTILSALEQLDELEDSGMEWSLRDLSEELRDSKEAVLRTLRRRGWDFDMVSARLKNDPEVARVAIASHAWNYESISPELQQDRDLAMQAASKAPELIERFPADLMADRAFVEELIALEPRVFHALPAHVRDAGLMDLVSRSHPEVFAYDVKAAPYGFFMDRMNVLRVVSTRGRAIEHLDAALVNDEEVMLAALRNDLSSAALLRDKGLVTRERVLQWVAELPGVLAWLPEWADDEEMGLCAVGVDGSALEHLSERLRNNRQVVLAACMGYNGSVRYAGEALLRADAELRTLHEQVLAADDELPF